MQGERVDIHAPDLNATTAEWPFVGACGGIVSKPVQKLVGRLTLFEGISQVLGHRTTT